MHVELSSSPVSNCKQVHGGCLLQEPVRFQGLVQGRLIRLGDLVG